MLKRKIFTSGPGISKMTQFRIWDSEDPPSILYDFDVWWKEQWYDARYDEKYYAKHCPEGVDVSFMGEGYIEEGPLLEAVKLFSRTYPLKTTKGVLQENGRTFITSE